MNTAAGQKRRTFDRPGPDELDGSIYEQQRGRKGKKEVRREGKQSDEISGRK